jgi:hypothetical protein
MHGTPLPPQLRFCHIMDLDIRTRYHTLTTDHRSPQRQPLNGSVESVQALSTQFGSSVQPRCSQKSNPINCMETYLNKSERSGI